MKLGLRVQAAWGVFRVGSETFDLGHLDERVITIRAGGLDYRILVRFSDHCFTEDAVAADERPVFAGSSRRDGRFCQKRYSASLGIWTYLDHAMKGRVWLGEHDRYLVISVDVREGGNVFHYIIAFTLEKFKGVAGVSMLMRVRTAFLRRPDKRIATYGDVRFVNLVTLRAQSKAPKRIFSGHRKKPW